MSAYKIYFIFVVSLFFITYAEASISYHTVEIPEQNGATELRVIYEDLSLRTNQSVLSQELVYRQMFSAEETVKMKSIEEDYRQGRVAESMKPALPTAGQPLWIPVKDQWTPEDETAYSHWFSTEVNTDFDSGTGLLVDCADVGLLFRWVYARNNKLPIANTLTGSGKLFGHFSGSSEWDHLPTDPDWRKDERFKAALHYLFDNTYTGTINNDQYPTRINPQYVRPGSMFMIIRPSSGHTQTIKSIDSENGIQTYWGNEPSAEQIYSTEISVEVESDIKEGFKSWRWVQLVKEGGNSYWSLIDGKSMPGYSLEQYQPFVSDDEFLNWVYAQLGIQLSDDKQFVMLFETISTHLSLRLKTTGEGFYPCYIEHCAQTSADYNSYSTPARDARITEIAKQMQALLVKLGPNNPTVKEYSVGLNREIIYGTGLSILSIINHPEVLESDPTLSFEERWGLSTTDPTIHFYDLSKVILLMLNSRDSLVWSALQLCFDSNGKATAVCAPGTDRGNSLSTAGMDEGIHMVYSQMISASTHTGLDPNAVHLVRTNLLEYSRPLSILDPICGGQMCTYDSILWGTNAAERIERWSPNAYDPTINRWGFQK